MNFCPDFQNSYFSENLFCGWSTLIDFDLLKELLKLKTKQKNYNYNNDDIEIITISIIVVIIILIILIWQLGERNQCGKEGWKIRLKSLGRT